MTEWSLLPGVFLLAFAMLALSYLILKVIAKIDFNRSLVFFATALITVVISISYAGYKKEKEYVPFMVFLVLDVITDLMWLLYRHDVGPATSKEKFENFCSRTRFSVLLSVCFAIVSIFMISGLKKIVAANQLGVLVPAFFLFMAYAGIQVDILLEEKFGGPIHQINGWVNSCVIPGHLLWGLGIWVMAFLLVYSLNSPT